MLEELKEKFLRHLRFEKRYSPLTVSSYESDLRQFSCYLQEFYPDIAVAEITHQHIRGWLAELSGKSMKATALNRKISTLRSFFRFLRKEDSQLCDPTGKLHALRAPERLPVFLRESETTFLFEEIAFGEGFEGFTQRLICELLYQTGMRRAELINLKESDIEWNSQLIRILGKGNKERLVPVSKALLQLIKDYIEEKQLLVQADVKHLLILKNGCPLYASYVYRVVHKYIASCSTVTKKSPHVLRHTFATQLLNGGANIQAIKDLLGHSSLAATQVYTHINIERLKQIHQLNHPRG